MEVKVFDDVTEIVRDDMASTFVKEKAEKQKREFYIPRLSRENSWYGTEFEIKLRNEMTQKAIIKEREDWIRRKGQFKSNTTGENMGGFVTVSGKEERVAYKKLRRELELI